MKKLEPLSVWAVYSIRFSQSKLEYATTYSNIAIKMFKGDVYKIKYGARVANELYKKEWPSKEELAGSRIEKLKRQRKELWASLNRARQKYKDAVCCGVNVIASQKETENIKEQIRSITQQING